MFGQCQKQMKKGSLKVLHGAHLRGGGPKAMWAIPIWKQYISKGASLIPVTLLKELYPRIRCVSGNVFFFILVSTLNGDLRFEG